MGGNINTFSIKVNRIYKIVTMRRVCCSFAHTVRSLSVVHARAGAILLLCDVVCVGHLLEGRGYAIFHEAPAPPCREAGLRFFL